MENVLPKTAKLSYLKLLKNVSRKLNMYLVYAASSKYALML